MSDNQKSILVASLILLSLSIFFIYLQNKNIEVIEDVSIPSQKVLDRRCLNFDKVVNVFKDYIPKDREELVNNSEKIIVRSSENKPFLSYPVVRYAAVDVSEEQRAGLLIDFQKNIEPELKKIGLINEFAYPVFNSLGYQFRQEESIYNIIIPTNSESSIELNNLSIKCGQIDEEKLRLYSLVSNNFKPTDILEIWSNIDNVLYINLSSLEYLSGSARIFDISKTPELIYAGQEAVNCSELKERNIGKGVECISDNKYIINQ